MCESHDPDGEGQPPDPTHAGSAPSGPIAFRCRRCDVEFRLDGDGSLDELVAAVQRHTSDVHDHEVSRDRVLARLGRALTIPPR
ncbi:MAG: hypothetical protein ACRD0Q_08080 [Acidimicrobiales bacterium]